jgi:endonuclease-3
MMPPPFKEIIRQLITHYGRPKPPQVTDPFEMILWENVAYLVDDDRRAKAFHMLRQKVGLTPERIAAAPKQVLVDAARLGGMLPDLRADRLRFIAELTISEFDGDLRQVLKLPLSSARKALKRFPSIGDPGAEKILLFAGAAPLLALESNGLRVLVRLGYCEERKSYGATYRAAQEALADQTGGDCPWLTDVYLLLRRHGQELCRRTGPACHACPLASGCHFARFATGGGPSASK